MTDPGVGNPLLFTPQETFSGRLHLSPRSFSLIATALFFFKDRLSPGRAVRTANWFDPWFRDTPTSEEVRGLFTLIFARLVFARRYANDKSRLVLPPEHSFTKHFQDIVTEGYSSNLSSRPSMSKWQKRIENLLSQTEPQFRQKPAADAKPKWLKTPEELIRQKLAVAASSSIFSKNSFEDFKKGFIEGLRKPFLFSKR